MTARGTMNSFSVSLTTINNFFTNQTTPRKSKQRHKLHQNTHQASTSLKQSPPSLFLNANSNPHTKIHALETVVNKLEASSKDGIMINEPEIFASLLETCFHLQAIDHGVRVHRLIPKRLLRKNVGISSKLVRLYATNGHLEKAHELFDQMPMRNESAFTWNSLISGYADNGLCEDALALYFQMVEEGVEPDGYTFPRVLKACGGTGSIYVGEEIHRHVIRYGFGKNVFVQNSLVDMYAKCGDILRARKVFKQIDQKDLVSWNSMLIGCIRHELTSEAMNVLRGMVQHGHEPDTVSVSAVLTGMSSSHTGTQIHAWVLRRGMEWNLSIANSLISFYCNHGKLEKVRWLFECMPERDTVSWNSIISAHSKQIEALQYFERMLSSAVSPDVITFVALLSACARMGMVDEGEMLFEMMRERYGITPAMEHYASMVNLYARAGYVEEAYNMIEKMDFEAGSTVWGALLYGCHLHGKVDIAEMASKRLFELEPDNEHNFNLMIKIYSNAGRLEDAEKVRLMMVERGLDF